jgi:hypothetical protein
MTTQARYYLGAADLAAGKVTRLLSANSAVPGIEAAISAFLPPQRSLRGPKKSSETKKFLLSVLNKKQEQLRAKRK